MLIKRELLSDPSADASGLVDHPVHTGPFDFDVLGSILLYLEDDDKQSLVAVSGVCSHWRYVANLLPQWSTWIPGDITACDKGTVVPVPKVRDEIVETWLFEMKARREKETHDGYARDLQTCERFESSFYVLFLMIAIALLPLWIAILATNNEWPQLQRESASMLSESTGSCLGDPSRKFDFQVRRFSLDVCVKSKDSSSKEEWKCHPMRDLLRRSRLDEDALNSTFLLMDFVRSRFRCGQPPPSLLNDMRTHLFSTFEWMCRANDPDESASKQLAEFENANAMQIAGLSLHGVSFVVLAVGMVCLFIDSWFRSRQAWWKLWSIVSIAGIVGFCMSCLLIVISLALLEHAQSTPCTAARPSLKASGWSRSDGSMGALVALTLLQVAVSAFLLLRRTRWLRSQDRMSRKAREAQDIAYDALANATKQYHSMLFDKYDGVAILGCTVFCVLSLAAVITWIVAMASNPEWPAITASGDRSIRLRRFSGLPSICFGGRYSKWDCHPLHEAVNTGMSTYFFSFDEYAPLTQWLCPANVSNQLSNLQTAATFQTAGLSAFSVSGLCIFVGMIFLAIKSISRGFSSGLLVIAAVGMIVSCALMLASLRMIHVVFTSRCTPSAPTAQELGWKRSDDTMLYLNGMGLAMAVVSLLLLMHRHLWVRHAAKRASNPK